jgi:hypothetical protein
MKQALSLAIVVCLIAVPFSGCATSRGPRQLDAGLPDGPQTSSWSRVREVAPAKEIFVKINGAEAGRRYFVMADDSRLVVLNFTDPVLPARLARVLRDLAAQHPEYFAALNKTGGLGQDNVRIGRDGVFVADRRVADLTQVVETITREDVSEIWGPVVARGSTFGAVLGGWLGFAVGAVPALGGAPDEVAWLLLLGSVAVGGFLGFHWSSHETEGLVYRAP